MRSLSQLTPKVASKCFERKYISLGRIVKEWRAIVGDNLADKAQPVKLHYRKGIKGKKPETRLDIATTDSHATVLKMQVGLILERINRIFGEDWVSSIRFVSTPANTVQAKPKKLAQPLTLDEKKTLSGMLETIEDPEIQARLNSLGQSVLMEDRV